MDPMNKAQDFIKRYATFLYLCMLAVLAVSAYNLVNVTVTGDMSVYMNQALNILKGYGGAYDRFKPSEWTMGRSPLFSLFVALSFKLFGVSLSSAFYVVKAFCILNVLLVFCLGNILFGKEEGAAAGVLAALSPNLGFWSYRHLDSVWVSFVLLSVLSYVLYISKERRSFLFLSGILMGVAFMIKEAALLLFIYPAMVLFFDRNMRRRRHWFDLIFYIGGILLSILPWALYLLTKAGSLINLLRTISGGAGGWGRIALRSEGTAWVKLLEASRRYFWGLLYSPADIWKRYSPVFPLFAAGWLYLFYRSAKGFLYEKIFIILLVLFSPIIAVTASYYARPGQINFFIIISFIAAAVFLTSLSRWISRRYGIDKNKILISFIILALICNISFSNRDGKTFLKRNVFIRRALAKSNNIGFSGWYSEDAYQSFTKAGLWIKENLQEGDLILHDLGHLYRPVYFYSEAKTHFVNIPIRSLDAEDQYNIQKDGQAEPEARTPIYIDIKKDVSKDTWLKIRNGLVVPEDQFYAIMAEDLFEYIDKEKEGYVLLLKSELAKYLDTMPSFARIDGFEDDRLVFYSIVGNAAYDHRAPLMTDEALDYLKEIKLHAPRRYQHFLVGFFKNIANISPQELAALADKTE